MKAHTHPLGLALPSALCTPLSTSLFLQSHRGQLAGGPLHFEEIDVVTALSVILEAFLVLWGEGGRTQLRADHSEQPSASPLSLGPQLAMAPSDLPSR